MSDSNDKVRISNAKGSPMLTWVGKRLLTNARAYGAQSIKSIDAQASGTITEDEANETQSI